MATKKHHRHHGKRRRSYGDPYVSVPSFSEFNPLGLTVKSSDIFLGAGAGLTLGAGVKFLLNWLNVKAAGKIPAVVMSYAGPISTAIAALALYVVRKKSNRAQAEGLLVGGLSAAAAPVFWTALGKYGPKMRNADGSETPFFADYIAVQGFGLLTADQLQGYARLSADESPELSESGRNFAREDGSAPLLTAGDRGPTSYRGYGAMSEDPFADDYIIAAP